MDFNTQESYLDSIGEMVVDEDKIVTYKSLSSRFGIHVNTAKQLLSVYLLKQKSQNAFSISVTYLLAGTLLDGTFNVTVANEDDFESSYSKFKHVTSKHIYSLQKGENMKDVRVLIGVNKESQCEESTNLIIRCSKGFVRCVVNLADKVEYHDNDDKGRNEMKIVQSAIQEEKNKKNESLMENVKTSLKNNVKEELRNTKIPNIANLFANAEPKSKSKKMESKKKEKEEKKVVTCAKEVENKSKEDMKSRKTDIKRKRIQTYSDSEESENEEHVLPGPIVNDSEMNSHSVTLEDEVEKVHESFLKNKRKKRKMVDKTVMNEDGYLETRKEVVFETDSEEEPEEKATPREPKKDKGKGTLSQKKQSSLFHFFKKN